MDKLTVSDDISILSYNSYGLNKFKADFINKIFNTYGIDVFAIQEHLLLKHNLFKINEHFPDYDVFAIPAIKANSDISRGRPSGGLAFIYKSNMGKLIKRIVCPSSNRAQGLQFFSNNSYYVFINVYFPVDKRNNDIDALLGVFQDIKFIIDSCENGANVVLLGDLNCDFSRNTFFATHVKQFLVENNLQTIWSQFPCDFTYSQDRVINGRQKTYFSLIDHFCVKSDFINECIDAGPIHSPDNLSDHIPIFLKFKCNYTCSEGGSPGFVFTSKPNWDRATDIDLANYKSHLLQLITNLSVPTNALNCRDVHCKHIQHKIDIDVYATSIMDCISFAVESNIPHTAPRPNVANNNHNSRGNLPGWSENVKSSRDDSLFWHSIWISAGRPLNCELHNVMKRTRNRYHYAIHSVKKQESKLRKEKMVQQCLNGKINDILKHIKSSRKNKSGNASTIDGVSGAENITTHFKNIYEGIYNQHNSADKVDEILSDLNAKLTAHDTVELDRISTTLINTVICNLHNGKSDSEQNWGSDALRAGADMLSGHLCALMKSYLVHGYISDIFLTCSLIPLVKNPNESKLFSDNYRLIAISSLILKLFDYVILELFSDTFSSVNLQFGFQKNLSTTMCSWTILETVNYYINRDTSVFICFLDLSKAFDTVKHDLLFKKLAEKIPPIFLRVIIFSYLHQKCSVKWCNKFSDSFSVSNGVRQGAVLSPTLFNIYLDNLFNILKKSKLGCTIDNLYYGFLGYADDCALLSPSRDTLQKMLNICEKYFSEHGIKISTNVILEKSKTKCVAFNVACTPALITLYDMSLPWVDSYKHLGHIIHKDSNMSHDTTLKHGEFVGKVQSLRQELGDQDPEVFMTLVNIYLCSFYGSNLWDLFSLSANHTYTFWNKLIRSSFNLPYMTHRYFLGDICSRPHIRIALLRRFVKFYHSLKTCKKVEVRHLLEIQKSDFRSTFGRNCQNICNELNVSRVENIDISEISMPEPYIVPENMLWRVNVLKELLDCRDHHCESLMAPEDISDFITIVACA